MEKADFYPNIRLDYSKDSIGSFLSSMEIIPHSFGYQNGYKILYNTRITGDFELIFFVDGHSTITIDNHVYNCGRGDFVLIPPFTQHNINTSKENPHINYWVHFDIQPESYLHTFTQLILQNGAYQFHCQDISGFEYLYENLRKELSNKDIGYISLFKSLLSQILTKIVRHNSMISTPSIQTIDHPSHDITNAAIDFMRLHLYENPSMKDICSQLKISNTYLFKCFKNTIGMAPGQYLQMLRLKEVERLLLVTSMKISEISEDLNYSSAYYLSNLFRKHYHVSPKHYRNNLSN